MMMDVSEWTRGRRVNRGVFILLRMRRERGLGAGNNANSELSALRRRGTRLQVLVQQLLPHVKLSTAGSLSRTSNRKAMKRRH
jgi:hypothetical protein